MDWNAIIEQTLHTTKANIARFEDRFPHVGNGNGKYQLVDHTDWTEGFWPGILWLSCEYGQDSYIREAAVRSVHSFQARLAEHKIWIITISVSCILYPPWRNGWLNGTKRPRSRLFRRLMRS